MKIDKKLYKHQKIYIITQWKWDKNSSQKVELTEVKNSFSWLKKERQDILLTIYLP